MILVNTNGDKRAFENKQDIEFFKANGWKEEVINKKEETSEAPKKSNKAKK